MSTERRQESGQPTKVLLVLGGAAVVAAAVTAILVATGLAAALPPAELRTVDVTLAPWVVVSVVLFVLLAFAGVVTLFLDTQFTEKTSRARSQWADLPEIVRAVLVGLPFAVVAALAAVATNVLATALSVPTRLASPLLVWLAVTAVAFEHLRSADQLAGLHRRLWAGVAVGAGATAAFVLLDKFVDSVDAPGHAPLVVLLGAGSLAATLLIRSARREGEGYLSALLVRTGFAQIRRVRTVTVALALGLLVGVVGALAANEAVGGILPTLLGFLLVWGLATAGAIRWFRQTDVAHSDLVVTGVRERSSGGRRELAVTNRRDERVDLRDAKIRDTDHDLYRTNVDVLLAPGQTETFDIPPDFLLFPSTDNLATDLPRGFAVSKRAEAPVIVTRGGEKFKLRWGEGVSEAIGDAEPEQRGTRSPDVDDREDNT